VHLERLAIKYEKRQVPLADLGLGSRPQVESRTHEFHSQVSICCSDLHFLAFEEMSGSLTKGSEKCVKDRNLSFTKVHYKLWPQKWARVLSLVSRPLGDDTKKNMPSTKESNIIKTWCKGNHHQYMCSP
jgi:hypothetical protein